MTTSQEVAHLRGRRRIEDSRISARALLHLRSLSVRPLMVVSQQMEGAVHEQDFELTSSG